jgi:drug/metabolite transporter (DMT)-like permease
MQVSILTVTAMLAFAANSILCRMALQGDLIDAATFTLIRLVSGTGALLVIVFSQKEKAKLTRHWPSALLLFIYMAAFSYSYLELPAGAGALILFGAVQMTMLSYAAYQGQRFSRLSTAGMAIAALGLITLLAPGMLSDSSEFSVKGSLLMTTAGVAWGAYSLSGKQAQAPLTATATNFLLATPMAVLLWLPAGLSGHAHLTTHGLLLAVLSGVFASAAGYAIWFAAVKRISAASAAIVQLSVPVIAGLGGYIWLLETPDSHFITASVMVLGGIWLVLNQRHHWLTRANLNT